MKILSQSLNAPQRLSVYASFKRNFDMKKYTKEQILIAAEIGEVSMIDARHIVSLLDEAVILERERKLRKPNVSKSFYCLGDAWGESGNGKCEQQCSDCHWMQTKS